MSDLPLELIGMRLVRPLSRTPHRETLLVHVDTGETTAAARLVRALDEFGAAQSRREIVALDRARGSGVLRLDDVVDGGDAPALIVEHLRGPSLAEVLTARERWDAGEAVALLAPLVDTVARMHAVGVAHGGIAATGIVVRDDGPVLDGLPHAELFACDAPEVVLGSISAVGADREALRSLAADVLARVEGARAGAARELAATAASTAPSELLTVLRDQLSELAAATPVRREDAPRRALDDDAAPSRERDARIEVTAPAVTALHGVVGGAFAAQLMAAVARLRGVIDGWSAVRRRVVVGGGAAVVAAAVLLAAVPAPASSIDPAPGATPQGSTDAAGSSDGDGEADARATGVDADPTVAVVELLELRERCMRELSFLCLESVDQAGSTALADDRAVIAALREGREAVPVSVETTAPRVVERLGDAVLVELGPETAPASLLLMRSEAGWRIRDWVEVP